MVGSAGWSYEDWKGVVYPVPQPREFHGMSYLAGYLDCVEINSSFYGIPAVRTAESWARRLLQLPEFGVSVKLWQGFTHHRDAPDPAQAEAMNAMLAPLAAVGRLAGLLVQFPFGFQDGPSARDRLDWIARAFSAWPRVIEVRHRSWLDPRAVRWLESAGYAFCNIDQPGGRHAVYPTALVTAPTGYVRLHGRNAKAWFDRNATRDQRYDYLYGPTELQKWVARIEAIRGRAERTLVITNNHFRGQAVVNAVQLRRQLGVPRAPAPPVLQQAYPLLALPD